MADCLEVALDNLRLGRIDSLQGTGFMDTPIDAVRRNIQISRETLNAHTILAMWAVFEREMIAVLEPKPTKYWAHPHPLSTRCYWERLRKA